MSSGHTDKTTINRRRRLTDEMRELLIHMRGQAVHWHHCDRGDRNRLRSLMNRGYAQWDGTTVAITQAGRDALK